MQLAIRVKEDPRGRICIFNNASDCSYFLGKKPNYVTRKIGAFYREHKTFKGLELSDLRKNKYIIVACENRGLVFNDDFDFNYQWYYHYGKTVVLKSSVTDKVYTFSSYSKCCEFLGRARNYFSCFKERKTYVISKLNNEKYYILQFKTNIKDFELHREYKSEENRIAKIRNERNKRYQKVSKLLNSINSKYDNLVEAYEDCAPEFLELQLIERGNI